MTQELWRGNSIELVDEVWVYQNDGVPVREWTDRPCGKCGQAVTPEGHDACLGTLPGAMNACCGHGEPEMTYVQLLDGSVLQGEEARSYIQRHVTGD